MVLRRALDLRAIQCLWPVLTRPISWDQNRTFRHGGECPPSAGAGQHPREWQSSADRFATPIIKVKSKKWGRVLRGSVAELLCWCFVLNCVRAIFHRLGFCIRSVRHSVQTRICWQTIDLAFVPMCPRPKCIISTPRNVIGAEQHQNLAYSAHSKQQIPAYCFQSDCSRLLACQCVVRSVCDVISVCVCVRGCLC
jgi:hypothetical protein